METSRGATVCSSGSASGVEAPDAADPLPALEDGEVLVAVAAKDQRGADAAEAPADDGDRGTAASLAARCGACRASTVATVGDGIARASGGGSYPQLMHGGAAIVDVTFEERYWYPDDGGVVWLAGYQLVDPDSGQYLARDAAELSERGLRVAGVAGAGRHHGDALRSELAVPGRPLALRRDPGNPHDRNAIAVHTAGGEQVGWVPRELAVELAPDLDAGRPWSAVILRERRPSPREPRTGLTMLLASAPAIELRARG